MSLPVKIIPQTYISWGNGGLAAAKAIPQGHRSLISKGWPPSLTTSKRKAAQISAPISFPSCRIQVFQCHRKGWTRLCIQCAWHTVAKPSLIWSSYGEIYTHNFPICFILVNFLKGRDAGIQRKRLNAPSLLVCSLNIQERQATKPGAVTQSGSLTWTTGSR